MMNTKQMENKFVHKSDDLDF